MRAPRRERGFVLLLGLVVVTAAALEAARTYAELRERHEAVDRRIEALMPREPGVAAAAQRAARRGVVVEIRAERRLPDGAVRHRIAVGERSWVLDVPSSEWTPATEQAADELLEELGRALREHPRPAPPNEGRVTLRTSGGDAHLQPRPSVVMLVLDVCTRAGYENVSFEAGPRAPPR